MRIVAFDTECANTKKHQICEFAYVEFDEGFNIMDFDDLYIHASEPDTFIVENFGIDLEINEEAPDYSEVYPLIKDIFERNDLCLAHGSGNDLIHFRYMNEAYGQFKTDHVHDLIDIIKKYNILVKNNRLSTICEHYHIPIWHHHAFSDAVACYESVLNICFEKGIIIMDLLSLP